MCRGARDSEIFLDTLGEIVGRGGWRVRKRTSVRNRWIKERLSMGTATNFADFLKRVKNSKRGKWGFDEFRKIKNIILSD